MPPCERRTAERPPPRVRDHVRADGGHAYRTHGVQLRVLVLLNPAHGAGKAHDEEDHVRSTASRRIFPRRAFCMARCLRVCDTAPAMRNTEFPEGGSLTNSRM